ncbi:MAG: GntR family transcriptional regulator [Firmicutes bacterium]|nr:GntR family transcriptional regulator [Bacillota bacterium]
MGERWVLDQDGGIPLYIQLKQQIIERILRLEWEVGQQLPTVRQLAVDLRINANTVARVYSELEREGYVSSQQGRGTFVRKPASFSEQVKDRSAVADDLAKTVASMASAQGLSLEELIDALESYRQGRGTV